jgi:hypothetical protein
MVLVSDRLGAQPHLVLALGGSNPHAVCLGRVPQWVAPRAVEGVPGRSGSACTAWSGGWLAFSISSATTCIELLQSFAAPP